MKTNKELAILIWNIVHDDLNDRIGILNDIDDDVMKEIRDTNVLNIQNVLDRNILKPIKG